MFRVLVNIIGYAALVSLLSCGHKPFLVSVHNGTGKSASTVVKTSGSKSLIHGVLDPDKSLHLTERVEDIYSIEYTFDGRTCVIRSEDILRAHRDKKGAYHITLAGC